MAEKINILVVDDHQIILDGLKSILDKIDNFNVVAYVNTAKQALSYLENFLIHVVITDIEMPEQNGIWLIKEIQKKESDCKTIVLTMHDKKAFVQELMSLGVHGYLLKTTSEQELKLAIMNVFNGKNHFSSDLTKKILSEPIATPTITLTERETQVLDLVAQGMSTKEIANQIHLSERTVEKHRASLLQKAGVKNVAGLIRFGFQHNLID